MCITVERSDGGIVDADIIRPRSWILASGLCAGRMLPLNPPELDVSGLALVTAIDDCPAIAIGLELDYRVSCYQVHGMDRHRETQQDICIEEE